MTGQVRIPVEVRIHRRVRRAANGCLEWVAYIGPNGYPLMKIAGKMRKVSRVVWAEANGLIPDGLVVMHKCDNPRCVELNHLALGTMMDNTQDMLAKGRGATGERQGLSKLSALDVSLIRKFDGRFTRIDLADIFGVSRHQIRRVCIGENWKSS